MLDGLVTVKLSLICQVASVATSKVGETKYNNIGRPQGLDGLVTVKVGSIHQLAPESSLVNMAERSAKITVRP